MNRRLTAWLAACLVSASAASAQGARPPPAVERLAVTTGPLRPFPFVEWPAEFTPQNTPVEQEVGHFLFWDGSGLQDVEGRTFLVTLIHSGSSGEFNAYLMRKTVHAQLAEAGAVRIAAGKIPRPVIEAIPEVDRQSLLPGLGDVWNDPVETWVIKRPHHLIWLHYTENSAEASLAVVASPSAPQ